MQIFDHPAETNRVDVGCPGGRPLTRLAVLAAIIAMSSPTASRAAPRDVSCGHVVSYFDNVGWRIFDPSSRKTSVFLPGYFEAVRWDTTFSHAYFARQDSVFRVDWKLGARPRFLVALPPGEGRWWFNPDSSCWQTVRVQSHEPYADSPFYETFFGELWQSSRDGSKWHVARADSVTLAYFDYEIWHWVNGTPLGTEAPVVTLDDLESEAGDQYWAGKVAALDTSTVALIVDEKAGWDSPYLFRPLQSSPRRGLAFQSGGSGAPEYDWSGVRGPLYFVDLDRRAKSLISDEQSLMRWLAVEQCGLVLLPGNGHVQVLDSAGRPIFSPTGTTENAVWVPRPRP